MMKDRITEDMKSAMRAKDSARLGTIRLLLAAIKQREVDERITLDDSQVVGIVDKLIKQRKDSIAAFAQAARTDLVDKERLAVNSAAFMALVPQATPITLSATSGENLALLLDLILDRTSLMN